MAGGLDEVDASVDAVVDDVRAIDLVLGLQVRIVSLLDVLHNGAPRVIIVHEISKTRSVNNSQTKADAVLLNVCAGRLYRHGLGDNLVAWASGFLRGIKGGVEERVHESGLSESRFT
jgi:hypothetical protein